MDTRTGHIYLTVNRLNYRKYIGKDVQKRNTYLGSGKVLKRAIAKYGRENFVKFILEECPIDELAEREIHWIKVFDTFNSKTGYNLTEGGEGLLGRKHTEETKEKIRKRKKGKRCSIKTEFKKGQKSWNKDKKGLQKGYWKGKKRPDISKIMKMIKLNGGKSGTCDMCNKEIWLTPTKQKQKHNFCSLKCYSNFVRKNNLRKGSNSPSWKGGLTSLALSIRHSYEYRQWRSDVFTRDDFTCQECNVRGGYLEAHHIKLFIDIIIDNNITTIEEALNCSELWDINNGKTLCKGCHNKTKIIKKLSKK